MCGIDGGGENNQRGRNKIEKETCAMDDRHGWHQRGRMCRDVAIGLLPSSVFFSLRLPLLVDDKFEAIRCVAERVVIVDRSSLRFIHESLMRRVR